MDWHFGFVIALAALVPGLWASAIASALAHRAADRWNAATTNEEIAALLPPGHWYDPETGLCHYPDGLAYRRGEMLVS